LGGVVLLSLLAPLLTAHDPLQPIAPSVSPPSFLAPLGTDTLGRDLWARLAYGGRLSLGASLVAASLMVSLGGVAGLLAASFGGWLERAILWSANATLAIPGLLLAMLLVAALGPGLPTVVLAVGLSGAPGFARMARTVFLQLQETSYVASSAALGAGNGWIALHHLLPNARSHLLSLATTHFAWSFMGTTTLTFLGFGGDPSSPEWGTMLNAGRAYLVEAPWLALWPGLAISLTILAVHSLGAWLAGEGFPQARG
jgi:ABC-type dipeptide/oligopeptide/nickel transport system permease subunit